MKKNKKEQRLMRIIWNEFGWQKPSGHRWKKKNQGKKGRAYENQYGFGYEEWLFNPRYRIGKFQYGFIRGMDILPSKKVDEIFLYTKDPKGIYFLVGLIKNVEKISEDEQKLKRIYKLSKKYLPNAIEELKDVNADYSILRKEGLIFNLRFKWKEMKVFDEPIPFPIDDSKYRRYMPYKLDNNNKLKDKIEKIICPDVSLKFSSGKRKSRDSYYVSRRGKSGEIKKIHVEILNFLYKYLVENKGIAENSLSLETSSVNRKIIDLLERVDDKKFNFYEVKTDISALRNIREAIGQLLEYSLFDKNIRPSKLVIVTPAQLRPEEKTYFQRLKKCLCVDLKYWFYDLEKKEISEVI